MTAKMWPWLLIVAIAGVAMGGESGWTFHPGNPLLKYDPALIDGIVGDPCVVKNNDGYVMYYGAAKGDFSDGNTVQIFRATSKDGVVWKRNSKAVLAADASCSWESVKVEAPSVIQTPEGQYRLYYSGSDTRDSEANFKIGLATSRDGVTWNRHAGNPVLKLGAKGTFDQLSACDASVILKDGRYWMWYSGISGELRIAIGLASSPDGIRWEKRGLVLSMDVERENPNDTGLMNPHVIWNGREFEMYYIAVQKEGQINGPIWRATSADGPRWKKDAAPLLKPGGKGEWTENDIASPSVLLEKGVYRMWFSGHRTDGKSYYEGGIGLAERIPGKNSGSSK